jgi:hypothetical protein
MAGWTAEELDAIGRADELQVAPARRDGTLRRPIPIWVVRVGDDLYVRSYRGRDGRWSRAAQATHEGHISAGGVVKDVRFVETDSEPTNEAVDEQYLAKYGRYGARYVDPMVAAEARATTIKLVPARGEGREWWHASLSPARRTVSDGWPRRHFSTTGTRSSSTLATATGSRLSAISWIAALRSSSATSPTSSRRAALPAT